MRRLLLVTTALISTPALADDARPDHDPLTPEIIVTAPFQRDRNDVLSATSVVTGDVLTRAAPWLWASLAALIAGRLIMVRRAAKAVS